ncbi:MAG TPA: helix-turn-helix transcriptional regulator [Solirubrobacteraceae bacterium]|nr:helix-turn-helix transcriptional regulator [Solirubrobacteraceae bacterium]
MAARGDKALGDVLRMHRKRRGESQEEVGYKAGLTAGTVSRIEQATARPEWETVRAIARALEVRLGDLGKEIEAVEGS